MQNDNTITFDDEEIIIRLKPEILEGHGWTGDLSINFEVFDNNPLNNEQYLAVFKLTKMMASLPLFMEKVGVLFNQIESEDQISGVVTGVRPPVKARNSEKKPKSVKRKGKVINIKDFKRK